MISQKLKALESLLKDQPLWIQIAVEGGIYLAMLPVLWSTSGIALDTFFPHVPPARTMLSQLEKSHHE